MRFYFLGFLFLSDVCLGMLNRSLSTVGLRGLSVAAAVQNIAVCLADIESNISKLKDKDPPVSSSRGSAGVVDRPSQASLLAEASISMDFNQIEDCMNGIKDVNPDFGRAIGDFLRANSPTYGASMDLDGFKAAKDSFFEKFLIKLE